MSPITSLALLASVVLLAAACGAAFATEFNITALVRLAVDASIISIGLVIGWHAAKAAP